MAGMTREEAHEALKKVGGEMHALHAGHPVHDARLAQLDGALATARMAVDHLFDHAENMAAEGAQG